MERREHNIKRQKGLTLLELMVALAVMAIIFAVGQPSYDKWILKKVVPEVHAALYQDLAQARNEALAHNATVRIALATAGTDIYSSTISMADDPTTTDCDGGAWTELRDHTITVSSSFEITGSGLGANVCFFRDGSSNGGIYNVVQKDGGSEYGSATIEVILATGALDSTVTAGGS
jgi:prepilin-type N-terminal cleavage/methylation domain-containing protein